MYGALNVIDFRVVGQDTVARGASGMFFARAEKPNTTPWHTCMCRVTLSRIRDD